MARASNHARVNIRRQIASDQHHAPYFENLERCRERTAAIIKGMGKAGQGKPAPVKRIHPNSPEGRAIAARVER